MPNVGNLDMGIGVDPSGMIRGFGRTKAEIQKFERALTTSTRSMGRGFTNLAVDFAVSGDVGVGAFKRLTQSAIGLAGLFGPTGLLVAGIGGTLITLFNFHSRAREEAEKTRAAYKNLLGNLSVESAQKAMEAFTISETGGQRVVELKNEIAEATRKAQKLADKGLETGLAYGSLVRKIVEARKELTPLLTIQQRWQDLVDELIESEEELEEATRGQTRAEKERAEALQAGAQWAREMLAELSKLTAPLKLPSVWEDLKKGQVKVDAFDAIKRNSEMAKETLKRHAEEWSDTWGSAIDSTASAFANFFTNVLSGHVTKFRDFAAALLGIWVDMIARMLAAQASASFLGALGIGIPAGASVGRAPVPTGPVGSHGVPLTSAVSGGGTTQVNVNLNVTAMDGASVARVLNSAKGEIVRLVAEGMGQSRQAQRAIRGGV